MPEQTLTFRHFVDLVVKRWKTKCAVAAAAAVVAGLVSLTMEDEYRSEARLLVHNSLLAQKSYGRDPNALLMDTFLDFFENRGVAERVIQQFQLDESPDAILASLNVKQLRGKDTLLVSCRNPDPELARDILGSFIEGAIDILETTFHQGETNLRERKLYAEVESASKMVQRTRRLYESARSEFAYEVYLNEINYLSSIIAEYERELAGARSTLAGNQAKLKAVEAAMVGEPRLLNLTRQLAEYPELLEPIRDRAGANAADGLGQVRFAVEAPNLVYEDLAEQRIGAAMQIGDASARIAFVEPLLDGYRQRLKESTRKRDLGKIAIDHAEYEYSTARDAYTNLMTQYQSVGAVVSLEGQQIQVIDPPHRPTRAAGPSRALAVLAAAFVAFALATMVSVGFDAYRSEPV